MKIAFFITLFYISSIFAQEVAVSRVAMLKPVIKGGEVTVMQLEIIRGSLTKALTNTEEYNAFTRDDVDAIANEQKFQQSGMVNEDQRTRMGQLSGAEILCSSSVTLDEGLFYVEVALIETKTGRILKNADQLMFSTPITELQNGCMKLAEQLINGKGSGNTSSKNKTKKANGKDYILVENPTGDKYKIGRTEVTNTQYANFLNSKNIPPSGIFNNNKLFEVLSAQIKYTGTKWEAISEFENYPMIYVTWYGAYEYCDWAGGRLPTEKEWEYAAKGGTSSKGYEYSGSNDLEDVAWFEENSAGRTHEVATKKPNELGIYDMSGNVWEWCLVWIDSSKKYRVNRGGSRHSSARFCRVIFRNNADPSLSYNELGFRVCIPL